MKNGFEPFDAPIVSDQKQHEIRFLNVAAQPSIRAQRKPRRRRKLRCIDAIGNDADILAVKITIEEPRGAQGNGDDGNFRVAVDAALQLSKKSVVNAPMEPPKTVRPCQIEVFFTRKLLEAMEKRVNDDNFGAQTVNSGRKDEIEPKPLAPAIPCAADGIQKKPSEKSQEMGTRDGGNLMPDDSPGVWRGSNAWWSQRKILNALGKQMNLAMLFAREAFKQFGKGALRAMPAVNEG